MLLVALVCAVSFVGVRAQDNKRIKELPKSVEIIEVLNSAEKCKDKKGATVRLRVISDSPVDIMRYASLGKVWMPVLFSNQKKGDEITDFSCNPQSAFKFFSRPAGSSEAFPKP